MRFGLSRYLKLCVFTLIGLFAAIAAHAHEFWISPHSYEIEPNQPIIADIRIGENFGGTTFAYISHQIVRFDVTTDRGVNAVNSRMGDVPALTMAADGDGLAIIAHQTTDNRLKYAEWEKFKAFVDHKGFKGVLDRHRARGLPETDFREVYSRYAKSIVAVGSGVGEDRQVGLETEIVALTNPYLGELVENVTLQVFYQQQPRVGAQLEVFEKSPDGSVEVHLFTTAADGRVTVPVKGDHEYLFDAVVIRPLEAEMGSNDPVWETLWASLTLFVPNPR